MLGDLVGYGADPNAVVERVRALKPVASVRGNHDKVAAGLEDAETSIPMARAAANWTREALTPSSLDYLRELCRLDRSSSTTTSRFVTARRSTKTCTSSPTSDAARSIAVASAPLCLFGHTHVALRDRWTRSGGSKSKRPRDTRSSTRDRCRNIWSIRLGRTATRWRRARRLRDRGHGPESSRSIAWPIPIEIAQKKILEAGLPPRWRIGWGWDGRKITEAMRESYLRKSSWEKFRRSVLRLVCLRRTLPLL